MKEPLYRVALSQGWEIVRKHKFLWILGLFASVVTAQVLMPLANNYIYFQQKFFILNKLSWFDPQFLTQSLSWTGLQGLAADKFQSYLIIIGLAILVVFAVWIIITAQIALIQAAAHYYKKKKFNFLSLIDGAQKKFWPVLFFNVFYRVIMLGIFMILSLPIFYFLAMGWVWAQIISLILFAIIYTLLEIIAGFIVVFSVNYLTLDNLLLGEAFKRAWSLFKRHYLISIETAIILFVLQILVMAAGLTVILLVLLPFIVIFYLAILGQFVALAVLAMALGIIIALVLALLVNGLFSAYYATTWTIIFMKLHHESPLAKIVRIEHNLIEYLKNKAKMKKMKKMFKK